MPIPNLYRDRELSDRDRNARIRRRASARRRTRGAVSPTDGEAGGTRRRRGARRDISGTADSRLTPVGEASRGRRRGGRFRGFLARVLRGVERRALTPSTGRRRRAR